MSSLYLHIPFCKKKCHYCSFSSFVELEKFYRSYIEALKLELDILSAHWDGSTLDTLFIGGGTPTVLESDTLCDAIRACNVRFPFSKEIEVSVECNPGTVDERYLENLINAGVTRLSLGVQSFNDQELQTLGRIHSRKKAYHAITRAKRVGFKNINLDLMYGIPGQSLESLVDSLSEAISLSPAHLSLYQLHIEKGTLFESEIESGSLLLPADDVILEMDQAIIEQSEQASFIHYEISNYCLDGYQCTHNLNYWHNKEYYGAGASAVSYENGCRRSRIGDPRKYIQLLRERKSPVIDEECLSVEASFRETVVMGLRLIEGVSLCSLKLRFGIELRTYFGKTLEKLIAEQFLTITCGHLRLTKKGRMFANRVMTELV